MAFKRVMGKESLETLQDQTGRIQLYVSGEVENYEEFKHWDLGDIVGASGTLFKTKTGELTIHASSLRLLAKALRPLPEKFHGISDQELKYRQRYLDLIVSEKSRSVFLTRWSSRRAARARTLPGGRDAMMQPIPGRGGAAVQTHHHALDMECFENRAGLYSSAWWWAAWRRSAKSTQFQEQGHLDAPQPEFTMMWM
jgi:lysyl-tRNA synthetase class 2